MERFKRILLLVLALCMVFSLAACGGDGGGNTDAPVQTGTEDPQSSETPAASDTAPEADGKVTYTVTVVDESGAPIVGAMVQICKDTCLPASTNEQGVAQWTQPEDDYKVSFMMMPEGYTADAAEFYFEDGSYELTITLKPAA